MKGRREEGRGKEASDMIKHFTRKRRKRVAIMVMPYDTVLSRYPMQGLTKDLNTGRDSALGVDPGSSEMVEGAFRKDKQINKYLSTEKFVAL